MHKRTFHLLTIWVVYYYSSSLNCFATAYQNVLIKYLSMVILHSPFLWEHSFFNCMLFKQLVMPSHKLIKTDHYYSWSNYFGVIVVHTRSPSLSYFSPCGCSIQPPPPPPQATHHDPSCIRVRRAGQLTVEFSSGRACCSGEDVAVFKLLLEFLCVGSCTRINA